MHTLHWIAVEAQDIEEAEAKVISSLTNSYGEGQWWDWFDETIGGRWSADSKTICASNSNEYKAILDLIKTNRAEDVKLYKERADLDKFLSTIDNYEGEDIDDSYYDDSLSLWEIKKIVDILRGDWNCDSYFYDTEAGVSKTNYLKRRVEETPNQQYLVPIDFHF
jgi:hypothetical protein